jgi:hypothetical protein
MRTRTVMDGCDAKVIAQIPRLPRGQVRQLLKRESSDLEVTKSLLNLLFNIVTVGSLPVTGTQKAFFDEHAGLVLELLGRRSLKWKKEQLEKEIGLVINIAASCPTVVGSLSPKTASTSSSS